MRTKKISHIEPSQSPLEATNVVINSNEDGIDLSVVETITPNTIVIEKKKRGRKKIIKPDNVVSENKESVNEVNTCSADACGVDHIDKMADKSGENKKERKQRKLKIPKQNKENKDVENEVNEDDTTDACKRDNDNTESFISLTNVVAHKKRGRKPRGGKIIHENQIQSNNSPEVPNIILHLKCVLSDLKKSNESISNKTEMYADDKKNGILCYNDDDQNSVFYSHMSNITKYESCDKNSSRVHSNEDKQKELESNLVMLNRKYDPSSFSLKNMYSNETNELNMDSSSSTASTPFTFSDKELNRNDCEVEYKSTTNKEIWKKISQLKMIFHRNDSLGVQRSACFWDTCEFDTPPIHIPMSSTKGYGCFCHPECAVAFLMNENIDTSVKFERYYLLNSIYGPIYNYNKSIKPAPNPHYLLNKFYGDLTINEYRKLFQCEQLIYMVNKPLTNVLPELYEDNNDFFIGNKIIQNNTIEIKKKVVKNPKSSIINEAFGIK
jgi:hypothetical protein